MISKQIINSLGLVNIVSTTAQDGNFQVDGDPAYLKDIRAKVVPGEWTWLRQVHGNDIVEVAYPGQHCGATADGAITYGLNNILSVTTADCAPVVLISDQGLAVLHAGWKSLEAGIIQKAAALFAQKNQTPVASYLGPCISGSVYEFGETDLERLKNIFGDNVETRTTEGKPALNMHEAVGSACKASGWPVPDFQACTSNSQWYSHRLRQDKARFATTAWMS